MTSPDEAPTEAMTPSLAAAAGADRCTSCGSVLAKDQRYCLDCGERRGQARFTAAPSTEVATATPARSARTRTGPRLSGATTLIAGVGTLLLAMGIGVLIGRTGVNSAPASSKPYVVNVNGGGSGTASTASKGGAGPSGASGSKSTSKSKSAKSRKNAVANNGSVNASNATKTVQNLPPPTVTLGSTGHGPGYQHGHFTGNFFGN